MKHIKTYKFQGASIILKNDIRKCSRRRLSICIVYNKSQCIYHLYLLAGLYDEVSDMFDSFFIRLNYTIESIIFKVHLYCHATRSEKSILVRRG